MLSLALCYDPGDGEELLPLCTTADPQALRAAARAVLKQARTAALLDGSPRARRDLRTLEAVLEKLAPAGR